MGLPDVAIHPLIQPPSHPLLKHSVAVEHRAQCVSAEQVTTREILLRYLLVRTGERFIFPFAGHHHHAIEFGEYKVAGMHQDIATAYGHVIGHDTTSTEAVEGTDAGVKDRESHRHDLAAVPNHAVAHATDRAIALGDRTHQPPPGRIRSRRIR